MLRLTVALLLGVLAHQTCADEPEAIVGGTPAVPGEFPYQCSMNMYNHHLCGCSILNATKILIAAHCVERVSPPKIRIRTGSIDSQKGNQHTVKSIISHPQYTSGAQNAWSNDIAVITLDNPIQFTDNEQPVTLPNNEPQEGAECVLSGWGSIYNKGPLSRELLKINTKLVNITECMKELGITNLTGSHICAYTGRGIGACKSDSGGPLVCDGVQYGIVSFLRPCAQGYPDVYTNVHHQLDFIRQQMASP